VGCGLCVEQCPASALSLRDGEVVWDEKACVGCDRCISVCPNYASPKIRHMTPDEVAAIARSYQPFIRGISVSGGECMLHPDWLRELFSLSNETGLGTLIDSNGTVPFAGHEDLLEVSDGVMLDVKAWSSEVFEHLTGSPNKVVLENLALLADAEKIQELRIVVVPGWNDPEDAICGIADTLGPRTATTPLKLIRFRRFGVKGALANAASPTDETMSALEALASAHGFSHVEIR
jgi:pyruvate formate lyase activating enzyme